MSAWIKMISDEDAGESLREALDLARTPHGTVDNVMRVHSLRPNTMRGHVILYRAALHDDANTLPVWLQETISSYLYSSWMVKVYTLPSQQVFGKRGGKIPQP